jgi:hypothetical protein
MPSISNSPKLIRGGMIAVEPDTRKVRQVIALQYNPDSITRSLQIQSSASQDLGRSEALRLTGPPVETIRIEAEVDAIDQLEFPEKNRPVVDAGLQPYLSALELLVYPTSNQLMSGFRASQRGELEIVPMEAPLTLFVSGRQRVVPVRITELNITEEAFDPDLNPIRARISLGMRVLSINDLGFDTYGGSVFLTYQKSKERLAESTSAGSLDILGLKGLP